MVLTHTNAGVVALRARLKRAGVQSSAYRLSTIDGFSMRLIAKFPARSGHASGLLELRSPSSDYPAIRTAARHLLEAGHVSNAIASTYSRLLVDEYQDCSLVQHGIISALAEILPTCVVGDPLQAIFGFRGNQLVEWVADVEARFPSAGILSIPWRWQLSGAEALGRWLLSLRPLLSACQPIDLRNAPAEVRWVQLIPGNEAQQRLLASRVNAPGNEGTVLVIGDAMNVQGRHQLASQTPGAMSIEAVDLRDLISFARGFDIHAPSALQELVSFCSDVMTGVGATNLVTRVGSLRSGRSRTPPTPIEWCAVNFDTERTMPHALQLVNALTEHADTRIFRPEILYCFRLAMQTAINGGCDFLSAALQARERNRHLGRPIPRRSVGSTLLLKGLEADIAVVLHPETMTPENLYVALTRGSKVLVVCSHTPILNAQR